MKTYAKLYRHAKRVLPPDQPLPPSLKLDRLYDFCRVTRTNCGQQFTRLGRIVFSEDGSLDGKGLLSKGSWHNTSRELSLYARRSEMLIPVAVFNMYSSLQGPTVAYGHRTDDEGDLEECALVPSVAETPRVIYLIASCFKYHEKTLPPLLKDLHQLGIDQSRIRIVLADSHHERTCSYMGCVTAVTRHRAFEYTALYMARQWTDWQYAFLLHDTLQLKTNFRPKVEDVPWNYAWDLCPAVASNRCGIGWYSREYVLNNLHFLRELHGITKDEAIREEISNYLGRHARLSFALGPTSSLQWGHRSEWMHIDGPSSALRIQRHFPSAGLTKWIHKLTGSTDL